MNSNAFPASTYPSLPPERLRVLLVAADDDGRNFLAGLLREDPHIESVQAVADATGALSALRTLESQRAHVVLMDHRPPSLDGFEATRRLMETHPLPIVVCSRSKDDAVFRALEAGAVACVEKPPREGPAEVALPLFNNLVKTLRLMSEVKVVRRWQRGHLARAVAAPVPPPGPRQRVVGIGASTGGPLVLQTIFAALPRDYLWPILVVQHIAKGFLPGLVEWLRQTSGPTVQVGAYGIRPEAGHIYLAPDGFQMGLDPQGRILLAREATPGALCPSVSFLFRSLLTHCGDTAVGVLLTGMGRDGAEELKALRDAGATTLAQDSASSVVHGMPGAAIALGAAQHVLGPDRIAEMLMAFARRAQRENEQNTTKETVRGHP